MGKKINIYVVRFNTVFELNIKKEIVKARKTLRVKGKVFFFVEIFTAAPTHPATHFFEKKWQ